MLILIGLIGWAFFGWSLTALVICIVVSALM